MAAWSVNAKTSFFDDPWVALIIQSTSHVSSPLHLPVLAILQGLVFEGRDWENGEGCGNFGSSAISYALREALLECPRVRYASPGVRAG
jgi:hypothetical protein